MRASTLELANISKPQVPHFTKRFKHSTFHLFIHVSTGVKTILPLKTELTNG